MSKFTHSYTKFIVDDSCNYLDAQTQNSQKMLVDLCKRNVVPIKQTINTIGLDNIEGFTNGGFSGNLSGEYTLNPGECPVGHTKDKNGCRQICTHCTYRDNEPKSRDIHVFDSICGPDNQFVGYSSNGYIKCMKQENNSEYYPMNYYSADSILVTSNPIHLEYTNRLY